MENNIEKNKNIDTTEKKEKTKKTKEMYFEKEKESYPWEKSDEKYKNLKYEIERDTGKSMKIDSVIMNSISNKFIEKLAELEIDREKDLKNILVEKSQEWALNKYGGKSPQGEAAIQALKSTDIDSYNEKYDASLKEIIEENEEREKRINDLDALKEAFSEIYSNGEVPFEARRAALFELNNIGGKDYDSIKLRADLFEKITGRNFEKEYGVIIDENKFKKIEIENYEKENKSSIESFIKMYSSSKYYKKFIKTGFSDEFLYKADILEGFGDRNIDLVSKRKLYNPKTWLFPTNIKYNGININKNKLEEIINTKWIEKQKKDIEISLENNNSKIITMLLGLTEEYFDIDERTRNMNAMKEQLENDFIAKKLKTEKDAGKLAEKYKQKGEKFDIKGFSQKAGNLYKTISDNSSFDSNAGNINNFMNEYGFETTWSDKKKEEFIKAAKKKSSLMRYIMKMILDKI